MTTPATKIILNQAVSYFGYSDWVVLTVDESYTVPLLLLRRRCGNSWQETYVPLTAVTAVGAREDCGP